MEEEAAERRFREHRSGSAGKVKVKRKGKDLHAEVTISLKEALLGFTRTLSHLDGHGVHIERTGVTKPGQVIVIKGEGMPRVDDDGVELETGKLHVRFTISFPSELSEEAQEWARKALPE